jgi:hypothetical protein
MGAAVTGSAADGREDRWSDIDLYFGVAEDVALDAVISDWTDYLYVELDALHHFELKVPAAVYRAFLLPSCLEVDLGFTPAGQFGAHGPHFRGVFGEAVPPPRPSHRTLDTSSDLAGTTFCTLGAASNAASPGRPSTGSAASGTRRWPLPAFVSGRPPTTPRGPTPCLLGSLASWRLRWCAASRRRSCGAPSGWRQPGCSVRSTAEVLGRGPVACSVLSSPLSSRARRSLPRRRRSTPSARRRSATWCLRRGLPWR